MSNKLYANFKGGGFSVDVSKYGTMTMGQIIDVCEHSMSGFGYVTLSTDPLYNLSSTISWDRIIDIYYEDFH